MDISAYDCPDQEFEEFPDPVEYGLQDADFRYKPGHARPDGELPYNWMPDDKPPF